MYHFFGILSTSSSLSSIAPPALHPSSCHNAAATELNSTSAVHGAVWYSFIHRIWDRGGFIDWYFSGSRGWLETTISEKNQATGALSVISCTLHCSIEIAGSRGAIKPGDVGVPMVQWWMAMRGKTPKKITLW